MNTPNIQPRRKVTLILVLELLVFLGLVTGAVAGLRASGRTEVRPYKPTVVQMAHVPGTFGAKISLLASLETDNPDPASMPIVLGLTKEVASAPFSEIAQTPASFFQVRPTTLAAAIVKVVYIRTVADRIIAGDRPVADDFVAVESILASDKNVIANLRRALESEKQNGAGIGGVRDIDGTLAEFSAKTASARHCLRGY